MNKFLKSEILRNHQIDKIDKKIINFRCKPTLQINKNFSLNLENDISIIFDKFKNNEINYRFTVSEINKIVKNFRINKIVNNLQLKKNITFNEAMDIYLIKQNERKLKREMKKNIENINIIKKCVKPTIKKIKIKMDKNKSKIYNLSEFENLNTFVNVNDENIEILKNILKEQIKIKYINEDFNDENEEINILNDELVYEGQKYHKILFNKNNTIKKVYYNKELKNFNLIISKYNKKKDNCIEFKISILFGEKGIFLNKKSDGYLDYKNIKNYNEILNKIIELTKIKEIKQLQCITICNSFLKSNFRRPFDYTNEIMKQY